MDKLSSEFDLTSNINRKSISFGSKFCKKVKFTPISAILYGALYNCQEGLKEKFVNNHIRRSTQLSKQAIYCEDGNVILTREIK